MLLFLATRCLVISICFVVHVKTFETVGKRITKVWLLVILIELQYLKKCSDMYFQIFQCQIFTVFRRGFSSSLYVPCTYWSTYIVTAGAVNDCKKCTVSWRQFCDCLGLQVTTLCVSQSPGKTPLSQQQHLNAS